MLVCGHRRASDRIANHSKRMGAMPHVTFIHGISNQPDADTLLRSWVDRLADSGLNLGELGTTYSMVYWADVMYGEPQSVDAQNESVDGGLGLSEEDEDLSWRQNLPDNEREFVERLERRLDRDVPPPADDRSGAPAVRESEQEWLSSHSELEAVPLPWFIKRRVMKVFLRDVHHYLFNATSEPRPGESYEVRTYIRDRFVNQLLADRVTNIANGGGKHVVVGHSMGTVISYDCLKNVSETVLVDGCMTLGSPLGLSEVTDNLTPGYSRGDGYPSEKVSDAWINVFDRLDPVALDSHLANDYRAGGRKIIEDVRVRNSGAWRHSSWKYLGQAKLCDGLRRLLDL